MSTSIDKFLTRVASDVQGAPMELMRQAVIDAATEFCERTRLWNEIQDAKLLVSGTSDYELELPSKARPISIEKIWCGSLELRPITMAELFHVMPDWQVRTAPQPIYYNSAFDLDGFRVYPKPLDVKGAQLRIKGSFQPTEASDSLPDFMWNRYRNGIASGAKAILMSKPSVVWSNPSLADVHQSMFHNAIADGIIQRMNDGVTNAQSVRPRAFR